MLESNPLEGRASARPKFLQASVINKNNPITRFRPVKILTFIALLSSPPVAPATTIVLPPEALPDMEILSAARFKARWPQVEIPDGYYPVEKGFWMTYQHQKLTYFFGPHETREAAEASQKRMEGIKDDLLLKDAARFASARTGILYLEFKPDGQGQPSTVPPRPPQVLDGETSTGSSPSMSNSPSENKGIRRVLNSGAEEGTGSASGNPEDAGNPLGEGRENPEANGEEESAASAGTEGNQEQLPTGAASGSESSDEPEEGSETPSLGDEESTGEEESADEGENAGTEGSDQKKTSTSSGADPTSSQPSGENSAPPQSPSSPTQNQEGQSQSGESQSSNTGDEEPPSGPKIDTSKMPEPPIQSPQQDKVEEPEEVPLIIKILKRIFG